MPASCAAAVSPSAKLAVWPVNPGNPGWPLESSVCEVVVVPAVNESGGGVVRAGRSTRAGGAHSPALGVLLASGANTSNTVEGGAVPPAYEPPDSTGNTWKAPNRPLKPLYPVGSEGRLSASPLAHTPPGWLSATEQWIAMPSRLVAFL